MTSAGPESEELLIGPRKPLFSRRAGIVALVLVAVGTLIGVAAFASSDPTDSSPAAAPTSSPLPRSSASSSPEVIKGGPPPGHRPRPWPTALSACGNRTDLPIVRGVHPVASAPQISLLVGSTRLFRYELASGRRTPVRVAPPSANEVIGQLGGRSPVYAATYNCAGPDIAPPRLLRVDSSGATAVALPPRFDEVLIGDQEAFAVRWPKGDHAHGQVVPATGGTAVRLPAGFAAYGAGGGVVAGNLPNTASGVGPLLLVDAGTGEVRSNLGAAQLLAIDDKVVVWTTGCEIESAHGCQAYRRAVTDGAITTYRLPRPPGFGATVLSRDHRLVAFVMQRARPDPRFTIDHPFPPADIVVLDLDTGTLDTLPGVEIPAKTSPALAFTADNRLVVALDAGPRIRLLLWRAGDRDVIEVPPVPGLASAPPALLVLPGS